ncbi:histone-lysine N-methyltransferase SETMAR [Trichonephila clavipes]|nr:histone-lysine N-methyltransferase SETMAR [Trichonephila clavipes]
MRSTRGLLATDHVILNHGQVTWTTPELAPPLLTTTPHQREDVSALDRFNVHRCPTRRVFNGTGLEPVTKLYLILVINWGRHFTSLPGAAKLLAPALLTGRPVDENVDKITEIIEVDRHVSSRSIAEELKIDHKTVLNHLRKVGFKKKLDVWVSHQLTPKNMMDRISICEALAKWNEIDPFLKRVTGDEKWVPYDNVVRKRSCPKCGEAAQTVAKPGLTARKILLCIWWEWKGIIYYELLPYGQTHLDYQQLDRLKLVIDQKQPELANGRGVVFHQDNARPHTFVVNRQKL